MAVLWQMNISFWELGNEFVDAMKNAAKWVNLILFWFCFIVNVMHVADDVVQNFCG